jgi:hypothetical protein
VTTRSRAPSLLGTTQLLHGLGAGTATGFMD